MEQERNIKDVLKCENISKTFITDRGTTEVIKDITLSVHENEFLVLFGPGQCGKTTLLNLLSGLEEPSTGGSFINDKRITQPGADRGVVFQSISLYPWLTVEQNVGYGPKVRGVEKEERNRRTQYYIDLVGLTGFEKAFPNKLSGGMKQRVGIARAYCNEPEILFMDEPFSALDAQTRYLMQEEIMKIWEKEKRTIVFVTNNIEEALYVADRIILMSNIPSQIQKEYLINLPRPRDYTSREFLELRDEITMQMDKAR